MNFTIETIAMEPFGFLSRLLSVKISLSVAILIILALGILVQNKLYSFMKSRADKRHINKIIYSNINVQNITSPILLIYFLAGIWIEDPSYYISDYGCYGLNVIFLFNIILDRSISFFINLFRYICVVQDDILEKHNIHPKVSEILFNISLLYMSTK